MFIKLTSTSIVLFRTDCHDNLQENVRHDIKTRFCVSIFNGSPRTCKCWEALRYYMWCLLIHNNNALISHLMFSCKFCSKKYKWCCVRQCEALSVQWKLYSLYNWNVRIAYWNAQVTTSYMNVTNYAKTKSFIHCI